MQHLNDLKDLLLRKIQLLWSIEKMFIKGIPPMIVEAKNPDLKIILAHHLKETQQHLAIIELLNTEFGIEPFDYFNKSIRDKIEQGKNGMSIDASDEAIDEDIIASVQKIEQYKISGYRSAVCYAEMLGYIEIANKLKSILEEQQQADIKLIFFVKSLVDFKSLEKAL
jgi:ferritin-like metal-binding protein YciE